MERLDGKEKWSVVESPRERRSIQTVVLNEAVFVQYLDAGAWHLAFYNDGRERETVSFSTNIMGETESALGVGGEVIDVPAGKALGKTRLSTRSRRWKETARPAHTLQVTRVEDGHGCISPEIHPPASYRCYTFTGCKKTLACAQCCR